MNQKASSPLFCALFSLLIAACNLAYFLDLTAAKFPQSLTFFDAQKAFQNSSYKHLLAVNWIGRNVPCFGLSITESIPSALSFYFSFASLLLLFYFMSKTLINAHSKAIKAQKVF